MSDEAVQIIVGASQNAAYTKEESDILYVLKALAPSMLINLGSVAPADVFVTSPRPGVTGTLPIANGGSGQGATAETAQTASGLTFAFEKWGKMVQLLVYGTTTAAIASGATIITIDDSLLRPKNDYSKLALTNPSGAVFSVGVDGKIVANQALALGMPIRGDTSYLIP